MAIRTSWHAYSETTSMPLVFLDDFGIFCLGMYCYVGHFFDFSLFVSVNMVISQAMIIFEC